MNLPGGFLLKDTIFIFLTSFAVAALAGLAALLRSGNPLTTKSTLSALLNSGFLGLAMSLLWYSSFRDNIYFLVGLSVLSGLGGNLTIELAMGWLKRFMEKFNEPRK